MANTAALTFSLPGTGATPMAVGYGAYNLTLTAPYVALSASGYLSSAGVDYTLSAPTMSAYGGANAAVSALPVQLTVAGTFMADGNAAVTSPTPTLSAAGTFSESGTFSPNVGMPMAQVVGYSGAVLSVTFAGGYTVSALGTTTQPGSSALTMPLFQLVASGTVGNLSYANLTSPTPGLGGTARVALTVPAGVLLAIGTATVSVTYEAYNVNLAQGLDTPQGAHSGGEVTHYAGFPFDYVVRYKNSYFGVNSTGMYLLEGTTDDGAAISFAVETAKTDFGAVEQKTVTSAYMGGRLGASETVTLKVGETGSQAYSYSTPRGTAAQSYRQTFGRGIKSRYYALAISGSDEFSLDSIDFTIDKLSRRI